MRCIMRQSLQRTFLISLGNNILIVAHASSLEACTCQLQGLSPQNSKDFVQMVRKVIFSPAFMGPVVLCVFVTVGRPG